MKAVFKHEAGLYSHGLLAYVFGAFLLEFIGIGAMLYNINAAVANFEYALGTFCIGFVALVPILTMRVLAEEKKQKTDQLLSLLPLSSTDVILGKYFAMALVFVIPMLVACLYPLIFSLYGEVYLPTSYGALIAFVFLGLALIAIGMFISSLTESQGMAAGIGVVVMLFCYYSASLADYIASTAFNLVALAVLCLAIFIATGVERHMDSISTTSEEILALPEEDLTAVSWTTGDTTLRFTCTDVVWQDAEDADFPIDQDKMADLLAHFASVTASFVIENVEDFAQYGLASPTGTVTLTTADGDTVLQLGDYSTMDSKRYVTLGTGTVYLIEDDPADYLAESQDDLMRQDTIPDYDTLDGITVEGAASLTVEYRPGEQLTYTDAYDYYLEQDGSWKPLDDSKVTGLVTTFAGLDRTSYASYTATEDDLAQWGLDAPAIRFTVTYTADEEQGIFVLAFGQDADGNGYMRMDDSPIVYTVDEDSYETITATDYDALRPDAVLALDWDAVSGVDFTLDDATYSLTPAGDSWAVNDTEVEFADVQSAVDGLTVSEFNSETPAKKQEIAFTVHLDNETWPSLTVALYQYDGESCLATLDGETLGLVDRALVVDLTEAVNAITLELE